MPPPRVLVIPGLDGHTQLWRQFGAQAFPGLRPVWFDHSADRADGGFDGLARRARAVLDDDEDGDAPAYVCGESFGGPVALTLARQDPARVRGLILISTFARYPGRLAGSTGLALWRLLGDRVSAALLRLCHPLTMPGALGMRCPPAVARSYLSRPLLDLAAYRVKSQLALEFDARSWLHEIRHPALVISGSSDPIVPRSAGQALAGHLPDATLFSVRGGHLAWCLRGTEVGARVSAWRAATERR